MSARKDLTGQTFGRLTVIGYDHTNARGRAYWLCKCECGKRCVVCGKHLRSGATKSCGCFFKESFTTRTHGMSDSKIYRTWKNIKTRCFNPRFIQRKDYSERGITMCERWKNSFEAFLKDVNGLEHFGEKGYTLDRIDNDKGYEPCNVKWATRVAQNRNQRRNVHVEYNGQEMTLAEASEKSGINYGVLRNRYHRGDRGDRLFRPVKK